MWDSAVSVVVRGVTACFEWMGQLFDAVPGSWGSVFTVIVILMLSRFLLGPILGASFSGSSDKVKVARYRKEAKLRDKARE